MKHLKTVAAVAVVLFIAITLYLSGCGESGGDSPVINKGGSGVTVLFFTQPG